MNKLERMAKELAEDLVGSDHTGACDEHGICDHCSERNTIEFAFFKGFRTAIKMLKDFSIRSDLGNKVNFLEAGTILEREVDKEEET